MFIQQMLQQTQAKLEQAQIAAVRPMDDGYPSVPLSYRPEKHNPDIRQIAQVDVPAADDALIKPAKVLRCLARRPFGSAGYSPRNPSRMARNRRRLSLTKVHHLTLGT